jgi:hypothetical protein
MHSSRRARPAHPQTRIVWRFFADPSHQWQWQQLAFDGTVVGHSKAGYLQYEACVTNATKHGYVAVPARPRSNSPNTGQLPVSVFRAVFEHRESTAAEESSNTG